MKLLSRISGSACFVNFNRVALCRQAALMSTTLPMNQAIFFASPALKSCIGRVSGERHVFAVFEARPSGQVVQLCITPWYGMIPSSQTMPPAKSRSTPTICFLKRCSAI